MTAQRSDLMTAKPYDPNSLEPWALCLVPYINPKSEIRNPKSPRTFFPVDPILYEIERKQKKSQGMRQ